MKVYYDKETDSLLISFRKGSYCESEEVQPGIVFDFDREGKVMAIDIEHASEIVDVSDVPLMESLQRGHSAGT